ncbi:MAG: hypothetical protein JXQ74_00485, partial [Alphaproteobacteria bacterium]|nr:hypothetical protein [Alphaproteobacteria bacterium]
MKKSKFSTRFRKSFKRISSSFLRFLPIVSTYCRIIKKQQNLNEVFPSIKTNKVHRSSSFVCIGKKSKLNQFLSA